MSDGGIGDGLTYWATINIRGNLSRDQLRAVLREVRAVLDSKVTGGDAPQVASDEGAAVDGLIVQAARLSNTANPQVMVTLNDVVAKRR